jgi:hypothetical protein
MRLLLGWLLAQHLINDASHLHSSDTVQLESG